MDAPTSPARRSSRRRRTYRSDGIIRPRRPRISLARLALALAGLALLGLIALLIARAGGDPAGAFDRAEAAAEAGDMRTARVEAMNAVDAEPGNAEAWDLLARSQIALGEMQAAMATVVRARDAGVDPGATRHLLAEALLGLGDIDGAIAETEAGEIAPDSLAEVMRVRGKAFAEAGDVPAAADAFNAAIDAEPENARLWADIAAFRTGTGELAGAIEAIDKSLEIDPDSVAALVLKGRLARDQYGMVASLPFLDRALEFDPANIPALLERAATLGELGRGADMLADTRDVLERDSGNVDARFLQAVLAARARDFALARRLADLTDGALEGQPSYELFAALLDFRENNFAAVTTRLEALLEAQPANREARRLLGAARFNQNDMRGALASLEPLARRRDADSYVLTLTGRALERLGDRDAAIPYLNRASHPARAAGGAIGAGDIDGVRLSLLRQDAVSGGAAGQVALVRGYLALGMVGEALASAQRLAAANPGAPDAQMLLGDALGAAGRPQDAASAYSDAANIRFNEPVALRLVEAYLGAGRPDEASRALALFRQQNPRNVATAQVAGQLNLAAGRWAAAAAIFEQLRAEIGDRDAAILSSLAIARYRLGETDRARALARRAYRLLPMNAATSGVYGWILSDSGADPRLGRELLEKAHALAPDDPVIAANLDAASG